MKHKISFFIIMILVSLFSTHYIDAKSQNTSKIVKSEYNSSTKELFMWGTNLHGNLGTGDYNDIDEENKIKVNDLISNQKIIEYVITDVQTYVLTDRNKVYASGYHVGAGLKNKRNTFVELKFYNQKKYKITNLKLIKNYCYKSSENLIYNDKCQIEIKFKTNNSKINNTFNNFLYLPLTPNEVDWSRAFMLWTYKNYGHISDIYPIYNDTSQKNKHVSAVVNKNGKLVTKFVLNKKAKKYQRYVYKNGEKSYYRSYSNYKDKVYKYKNGKISSKKIIYYKLKKDNSRSKKREFIYSYKDGRIKQRSKYVKSDNKMKIYSKKYYYPNKNSELKSNTNGKAKTYITYYKRGKAYKTYRWDYDKKGKMINKSKVKLKTKY